MGLVNGSCRMEVDSTKLKSNGQQSQHCRLSPVGQLFTCPRSRDRHIHRLFAQYGTNPVPTGAVMTVAREQTHESQWSANHAVLSNANPKYLDAIHERV